MLHGDGNIEINTTRGVVTRDKYLKNTHNRYIQHVCGTHFAHHTSSW